MTRNPRDYAPVPDCRCAICHWLRGDPLPFLTDDDGNPRLIRPSDPEWPKLLRLSGGAR